MWFAAVLANTMRVGVQAMLANNQVVFLDLVRNIASIINRIVPHNYLFRHRSILQFVSDGFTSLS